MESSNNELALRCQKGDKEAFGALYDRYAERLYRYIYFKTWNKDAAEDIVSVVFLKAFERIKSFNPNKGVFSQWIYGIARNAIIDYFRTVKPTADIEDIFDLGEDERTEAKLDARDMLLKVEAYLDKLNPRQREIVMLRIWEELPYREIAEIVGGSEDAVKVMFSRTIRELREKLGPTAIATLFLISTHVT